MAKRSKTKYLGLPDETKIEVVAMHPHHGTHVKEMTFGEAKAMTKKRGWIYKKYQLGYSQFNNNKK